jgi:hypothetical protein
MIHQQLLPLPAALFNARPKLSCLLEVASSAHACLENQQDQRQKHPQIGSSRIPA